MTRLDRESLQNPHDLYRRLRKEAPASPVVMWGGVPVWLAIRYAEANALLNDSRLSKNHARAVSLFPPGCICLSWRGATDHAVAVGRQRLDQLMPLHEFWRTRQPA
jgi:hypothetical protein